MPNVRRAPAAAGLFYPGSKEALDRDLDRYLGEGVGPLETPIGILVPHAGYLYSGAVAGSVYSRVRLPQHVLLMGPNHHWKGSPASLMAQGSWVLPFGEVCIDERLAVSLLEGCPDLRDDPSGHWEEHSLEVQLPFLHRLRPDVRFVPIVFKRLSLDQCQQLGHDLAGVIKRSSQPVVMITSSDMNHYESEEVTRRKDFLAIDRMLALDPSGLYQTVQEDEVSMCGFVPATVMLFVARALGAGRAELVRHTTSGEITGDYQQVVGYAGILLS